MKLWEHYCKEVLSGKRVAGELERLTIERFQMLIKKKEYYFDVEAVEDKLHIVSLFKHTKGKFKGVPFNILPWQSFFWAYIFGLKSREDNFRVVRESLLCMAKKGGKSEVAGATGVLMTYFDNQPSAECYSAANSTDQALYSWTSAKTITKQLADDDEDFGQVVRIYDSFNNHMIKDLETDSYFKTISSENKTLDGVNPHFAVVDEYHEAREDKIPKNLKSGMVGLDQPLLLYVTTRGFQPLGELRKLENKHIGLLRNQFTDDSAMSMIFSLDASDISDLKKNWGKPVDQMNKKLWSKPNPGIGIAPTWKGIETLYTDAVNDGVSGQTNVMVKNFNIWVRQSKSWLPIENWNKCARKIDKNKLIGKQGYGAYDLSIRWDLTAKGILFPPQDGIDEWQFICDYYCPEDSISFRAKRDKVPYEQWASDGLLKATPGNVIDYNYIREDIQTDHERYEVINWQYDPMFATELSTNLSESGINVNSFRQTVYTYNEPLCKLEEIIQAGQLNIGQDKILDWMFGNIAIRRNATGLRMFDKEKSQEKIDGMVVLAMCMAGYLIQHAKEKEKESVYEKRGIRIIE